MYHSFVRGHYIFLSIVVTERNIKGSVDVNDNET